MLEHSEGAEVLRIVTICHAGNLVVVPTKEAGFYCRFETTEDLNVCQLAWLMTCFATRRIVALVALDLLDDCAVVLDQSLLQSFPLVRTNTRVQGGQLPQRDKFVAHACAGILARLGVGVDIVLALPGLLEGHLRIEPPDHDLSCLQALQGDDLQERYGVAVVPLIHLPHYGQEVPHALWLSAS